MVRLPCLSEVLSEIRAYTSTRAFGAFGRPRSCSPPDSLRIASQSSVCAERTPPHVHRTTWIGSLQGMAAFMVRALLWSSSRDASGDATSGAQRTHLPAGAAVPPRVASGGRGSSACRFLLTTSPSPPKLLHAAVTTGGARAGGAAPAEAQGSAAFPARARVASALPASVAAAWALAASASSAGSAAARSAASRCASRSARESGGGESGIVEASHARPTSNTSLTR